MSEIKVIYGIGEYTVVPNSPGNVSKAIRGAYEAACMQLRTISVLANAVSMMEAIPTTDDFNLEAEIKRKKMKIVTCWELFDVYARTLPEEVVTPVYQNEELRADLTRAGVELRG